jgi:surfactin synthase thioesterase subunit
MNTTRDNPWLVYGPPGDGPFVLFGFHYTGVGAASTYRDWPRQIGAGWVCPLQPPGREDRIDEEPYTSHRDFAERVVPGLARYLYDNRYAFIGHCGAFPYMLETTFLLKEYGLPLPCRLFASSWGAPHRGLYGRLNFLDLDTIDVVAEVQRIAQARLGYALPEELAEFAGESLLSDLRVQRGYRYPGHPRVPVPTVVISWAEDDVVPPEDTRAGWDECAEVSHHELRGDHWEFLRCPPALRELIAAQMAESAAGNGRRTEA